MSLTTKKNDSNATLNKSIHANSLSGMNTYCSSSNVKSNVLIEQTPKALFNQEKAFKKQLKTGEYHA